MPVLVTGATGVVGRALIPRLVSAGGQVRIYVRRDAPEYRSVGVKVAVGEADDEGRLESALEQVHTIVHLVGGPAPERGVDIDWLNVTTTRVALRAAENAEVRRFLFLSHIGADPMSDHPYLAAKGRAEEAIQDRERDYVIFRCAPIVGTGSVLMTALRDGLRGLARLNPTDVADVAEALVASDTRDADIRGVWELGGAESFTLDELAQRTGRTGPLTRLFARPRRALVELYSRDLIADGAPARSQFGLR